MCMITDSTFNAIDMLGRTMTNMTLEYKPAGCCSSSAAAASCAVPAETPLKNSCPEQQNIIKVHCHASDVSPEKIYYKGKYTTVIWNDGTTTTVSCGDGETFDKYSGFCAALAKKMFESTTHVKKMIEELDVEENKRKAAEARAKKKEEAKKAEAERRERAWQRRLKRGLDREVERWMIEQAADEVILGIMEEQRREKREAAEAMEDMSGKVCLDACESCECYYDAPDEENNG